MKVLVVDDDVVSRMVLMHLVDSCGSYEIAEAEDGEAAWAQMRAGLQPAICFCDLRMPHLSGMALLARVKGDAALAAMRFVLASAANDHATMAEAHGMGAAGYLVKPFEQAQVLAQLAPLHIAAGAGVDNARATMGRLGIDSTRLLAYLSGFGEQLEAAAADCAGVMAGKGGQSDGAVLEKLQVACTTLGLANGAARLAMLAATVATPAQVAAALAAARDEVAQQAAAVRTLAAPA